MIGLILSALNFILILPGCAMVAFGAWSVVRKPKAQSVRYAFLLGAVKALQGLAEALWVVGRHSEPVSRENRFVGAAIAGKLLFGLSLRAWGMIAVVVVILGAGWAITSFFETRGGERVRVKLEPKIVAAETRAGAKELEAKFSKAGASDVASRSEQDSKTREKVADASREISSPPPRAGEQGAPDPVVVWADAIDSLRAQGGAERGGEAG